MRTLCAWSCAALLLLAGPAAATFSFVNNTVMHTSQPAGQPVIGDVTGDGLNDIVAFVGSQVWVYAQLSGGGYADPLRYDVLGGGFDDGLSDLKLADVTGDGLNDIIIGGSGTMHLAILQSNRLQPAAMTLESYPDPGVDGKGNIAVVDIDGDGRLDIVQAVSTGTASEVRIWRKNLLWPRKGRLFERTAALSAAYPGMLRLLVRDMNGDHRDDIVVASISTNVFSIFHGNVRGGFDAENMHWTANTVPNSFAVADVDGDGRPDAVWSQGLNSPETIRVQLQQPTGEFATPILYAAGDRPTAMLGGDIDNDGDDDVVVLNAGAAVGLYLQDPAGLQPQASFGYYGGQVFAVGDLDGDGCKDIVYAVHDLGFSILSGSGCQLPPFLLPDLSVALAGGRTAISIGMANRAGTQAIASPLVQLDLSVVSGTLQSGILPATCSLQAQTAKTQRIECLVASLAPGAVSALVIPVSFTGMMPRGNLQAMVHATTDTRELTVRNNSASLIVAP